MGHVFRHQQQPGAAEPGSSEFDAFIHSDLCVQDPAVASSMHPQPPPPQPPGAHVPATFPFVPYMCKQEDPALALWSTGTPPSALMCPDTTHAQAPAALRVPESSFANASIWTPSAAGQNATPTPQSLPSAPRPPHPSSAALLDATPAAAQRVVPPDPAAFNKGEASEGAASMTLSELMRDDQGGPWTSAPQPKRARTSESPEPKMRSVSATEVPHVPDMRTRSHMPPRRSASTGARRPPPSASQVTESGLPFPVIDTSAKHSSLFVPPDTSGLTKKEARLVKNRAAAFLSRQRKREQFEELACKCRALARLSWLLWDALDPQGLSSSRVSVIPPTNGASLLHEKLKYEPEDVRTTLQQVVQQRGTMIVENIMGDDAPSLKARTNGVLAQLMETERECEDLRAEVERLRAKTQEAPPSPASPSLLHLVGRALMQVRHASSECDAHDLLPRDDGSLHMQMRVVPTSDVVLCTLQAADQPEHADEAVDEKPWRCSTPVDSSEASVPSLSTSASPTLSSLSSGTASSRRHRSVMAYHASGAPCAPSASLLHEVKTMDLDEWVQTHGSSLDDISRAAQDLHSLITQRGMCLEPGCFLAATTNDHDKALPGKLTLYARMGTPASVDAHAHLVTVVRDTLRALHEEP